MKRLSFSLLAGYFLVFSAGIPMVTNLCGSDEQRTVCVMVDCESGSTHSAVPSVGSPDCCIAQITQAELRSAVMQESGATFPVIALSTLDTPTQNIEQPFSSVSPTRSDPAHHPPLFLQHRSFLI